ncbi:MAG: dephospho-CoA kinase [Thermodesulfobacteriota bacterium]|nr:dephospho-CoA kinase [Thermodesulfobacteriota bacterium]
MILGVTGGIASGKSTVTRMLQDLGAVVVSADMLSRELVLPGSPALKQMVQRFGREILHGDGTLDRKRLGGRVFADAGARSDIEAIMHPAIARLSQHCLQQAVSQQRCHDGLGDGLVVYEAPLLYEAGAEGRVDKVLAVTVEDDLQLRRLQQRDRCDSTMAQQRIDAHMSQHEKARRADYVIDNSLGLEQLQRQVDMLYAQLLTVPQAG